ncbi:MAG: sigma-70 family RNA polymerase sigma factor [Oscillospiraceae bacterium]|nr:sigma-70 family RNA polymerase sigma factor [Oscillospiraceae bacterium]
MNDNTNDLLSALHHEMYFDLVRIANMKLRDIQASHDIVQDAFIVALEKIDVLNNHTNPKGWIVNTLKNKILHEFRARFRHSMLMKHLEPLINSSNNSTSIELWSYLSEIIEDEELFLLKLIYEEGYSLIEVSEKLGISYSACRKRVQRAKDKIRKNPPE